MSAQATCFPFNDTESCRLLISRSCIVLKVVARDLGNPEPSDLRSGKPNSLLYEVMMTGTEALVCVRDLSRIHWGLIASVGAAAVNC